MEVGIEAGGGETFVKESVMVSWQEGDKLEIRPKVSGRNLRLGRGGEWGGTVG